MSSDGRYDVIIIGSGAGGGTLARHLAPSGKRILILERGDWLPREPENWDSKEVFVDNRYVPKETWYDEKDKPFQPGIHYAVGGATKMYGAALYRLRPQDFGELRHHDGISPAWPISYDDMEPYYTRAEHLYEVHGNHGEDSTEGHASASTLPGADPRAADPAALGRPREAGYHPFHAPCGVRLLADDPIDSRASGAGPATASRACPGQVRCRDARVPPGARARQRQPPDQARS
jgi:choline dehydrogenase-like flavoprotein